MITDTGTKIVGYIKKYQRVTAKELADVMAISPQALFRQLNKLQAKNLIYKVGTPPKVFYLIKKTEDVGDSKKSISSKIDAAARRVIDANYLIITPAGERKEGIEGFIYWCDKTGQSIVKTTHEYMKTWQKYNAFKKGGLVDGTGKLKTTFSHTYVDKLYYLDFYSIERFGKTKLGQLLLYSKQSQNIKLIKELIAYIKPSVTDLIKKWNIDGVGFIPPTVKREVQFMKILEHNLNLRSSKISIIKVKTEVAVPQKTLNKLEDRIENAQKTIIVNEKKHYKNILLIDDAVGSGATINETAAQIKKKNICSGKIIGLAITGSFKGFDVISEV